MTGRLPAHVMPDGVRVSIAPIAGGRVRLALDGRAVGPVLSRRTAAIVRGWLEGGGLDALEGRAADGSKLGTALGHVDQALDSLGDLFRNGLK